MYAAWTEALAREHAVQLRSAAATAAAPPPPSRRLQQRITGLIDERLKGTYLFPVQMIS